MKAKHRPGKKLLHCEEILAKLPEQHRTPSVFKALCRAKGISEALIIERVGLSLQFAKNFVVASMKKPTRKKKRHANGAQLVEAAV